MNVSFKDLCFKPLIFFPFSLLSLNGTVLGGLGFPRGRTPERSGLSERIKLAEDSGLEMNEVREVLRATLTYFWPAHGVYKNRVHLQ